MQTIGQFLEYFVRKDVPKDGAEVLFREFNRRKQEMVESRLLLLPFLVPVRSKNGWKLELSADGEIEEIAGQIEQNEALFYQVRCDILDFLEATGGEPTLTKLLDELRRSRLKLKSTRDGHEALVLAQIRGNHGLKLSEIEQLPVVAESQQKKQQAEAELSNYISDLEGRKSRAAALLDKYNRS